MKKTLVCVALLSLLAVSSATATIFSDGFESGIGNWTQVKSGTDPMQVVTVDPLGGTLYTHSGSNMASDFQTRWYASVMAHQLGSTVSGATVTFWVSWNFLVDSGNTPDSKPAYVEVVKPDGFALFGNIYNPVTNRNDLLGYRTWDDNGDTLYVATTTTLVRDKWYEAKFVTDASGIKGYWDGTLMFTSLGNFTGVSGIDFGTNYETDPRSGAAINGMFVDDVTVTPEPATLAILGLGSLLLRRKS